MKTLEEIADNYLALTPRDWEIWLQDHAANDRICSAVLSAALSGENMDRWAREHASSNALCE
jgi:hypothetical protein